MDENVQEDASWQLVVPFRFFGGVTFYTDHVGDVSDFVQVEEVV